MLNYLNLVLGGNVTIEPYQYPRQIPYYIQDGYDAQILMWQQNSCVILSPKESILRLPTLKKQLQKFQVFTPLPCALGFKNLSALQRRNLLENNIPFISCSQQIYLPFWGCAFLEKFKTDILLCEKMAPSTQLVFLYLYYLATNMRLNLTQLSNSLHVSKATCSRAVSDLVASNILTVEEVGNAKWIIPFNEKSDFLRKGFDRLRSPVERRIYVKNIPDKIHYKSGIQALSDITMIGVNEQDGAVAMYYKDCVRMPINDILSKQEFEDFGGHIVEAWSYDPSVLANHGRIDDISLLLCLDDSSDERIQMSLDIIREKYKLPIKCNSE
jgi:DNA-binding Lrp family transcriptional regulator